MPAFSNPISLGNPALDDPLIHDTCPSFTGGQVSNVRANLLREDEAASIVNCEINTYGEVTKRRGTILLGNGQPIGAGPYIQGLCYYEAPQLSYNYPVACCNKGIYYLDGTNWLGPFGGFTASSNTSRVQIIQGAQNLYWQELSTGSSHLYRWNGTALTDLGTADDNTHAPRGITWLSWHTNRLVAAGGYSTAAGATVYPDQLTFSDFGDGATWDRTKWSLRVGYGDSDPIVCTVPWTDFNLIVIKKRSFWVVNCDPQLQLLNASNNISAFQIKRISGLVGSKAPATWVQVGNDILGLADDGVRSINRTLAAETQTQLNDPLSLGVQDIIERINPAYVGLSVGFYYDNKYFLAVPLDSSTVPNYLLVMNTLLSTPLRTVWNGTWTGWLPTVFALRGALNGEVPGQPSRLMYGDSQGYVYDWLNYVRLSEEIDASYQDNGVDIPSDLITRSMTFSDEYHTKSGYNSIFEFNKSRATATCEVMLDGGGSQTIDSVPTGASGITLPVTLPFTMPTSGPKPFRRSIRRYGRFYELQFRIQTAAQKLVLRKIAATAFMNTMEIQKN